MATTSSYQLFDALQPEEYEALKADIAERDVQIPVEYDEAGNILDGYHRVKACQELGIKDWPRVVRVGMTEDQKREHILALNLARRHLTREQRAKLIVQLRERGWSMPRIAERLSIGLGTVERTLEAPLPNGKPSAECPDCHSERSRWGPADEPPDSRYEYLQCSECGYVRKGMPLRVTGRDGKGYPIKRPTVMARTAREMQVTLDALGKMDTNILPSKWLDAKRVAILGRERGVCRIEAAEGSVLAMPATADIRHCGLAELDLPAASVDLLFTDPPYAREFLPLWSELSALATRVLKPGCLLIAYTGQHYLPEVIARLSEHLAYVWAGALMTPGPHNQVYAHHIRSSSKLLLFFSSAKYEPGAWFTDTYTSERVEKEHHKWQQSEGCARYYIETLTQQGDMVLDPFLGGGTTAAASIALGRRFIGCDIDLAAVQTTKERLATHE